MPVMERLLGAPIGDLVRKRCHNHHQIDFKHHNERPYLQSALFLPNR
jgi:hypothetical protein